MLDDLDRHVVSVVTGAFRRLDDGERVITTLDDAGWRASGSFDRGGVEAVLADPTGWHELAGAPWLGDAR